MIPHPSSTNAILKSHLILNQNVEEKEYASIILVTPNYIVLLMYLPNLGFVRDCVLEFPPQDNRGSYRINNFSNIATSRPGNCYDRYYLEHYIPV